MSIQFNRQRGKLFVRLVVFLSAASFLWTGIAPYVYASSVDALPIPSQFIKLTSSFNPPSLRGLKFYPDNPLKLDFIIDEGDSKLTQEELKEESAKLIRHFLASLTIPEEDLWVNLSPLEQDRIIPQEFGLTEMGQGLLGQDYLLKQLAASITYPDSSEGKAFWDRVYAKASELFGTTNIPINTYNKIWIIPDTAQVYEDQTKAILGNCHLKVMLEEDYLALKENLNNPDAKKFKLKEDDVKQISNFSSMIMKDAVIPSIEREINQGRNFQELRQIYHSLILATWFKQKLKDSILNQAYFNQKKIKGVDTDDPDSKEKVYQLYLQAYKQGLYNYIRKDTDPASKRSIQRKYFSGGVDWTEASSAIVSSPMSSIPEAQLKTLNSHLAGVNLFPIMPAVSAGSPAEQKQGASSALINNGNAPFTKFVSALRNHIGKRGSPLYEEIKARILKGEPPITDKDNIGNISNVNTLGTFIDEHFALPEEAVRELITNAYDSMHTEPVAAKREVRVKLADQFLSVSDKGSGMGLDTILKKFFPPFEGGKSNDVLMQIKNILADAKAEKIFRIGQFIAAVKTGAFSDTEKLTINDIQRRIEDESIDETQRLKAIENLVTFTGRFGIGFYSLLYFLKTNEDSIEVVTSTGTEAYQIKFFMQDGELQTAVTVLNPDSLNQGTTVVLKSQSFNKTNAQLVINQFLRFNANARISVSIDGMAPTVINSEVFNPDRFARISDDDTQVEAFYSKGTNITGKTAVYINVHGVTIMTKQIEGFGMPETVVFNFPANIGLPISRNKILVNEVFIEKAKDMIKLIAPRPELLSAFFPCIEVLESSAKASFRNILANQAADAAYKSWSETDIDLVYLPNQADFSKVKHIFVALVDSRLLRMALLRGLYNRYYLIGEPLTFSSGQSADIANKRVYLVDFTDETKFVATSDAILINRKHTPKADSDKALYNVLLELNQEGRFKYTYQPQTSMDLASSEKENDEILSEDDPRLKHIFDSLPDERAKLHFKEIVNIINSRNQYYSLGQYIENPALFLMAYNGLVKNGLINIFGNAWIAFYRLIPWNHSLDNRKEVIQILSENERIKQLHEYFMGRGISNMTIDILFHLMDWSYSKWGRKECSQEVRHQVLERLWELREFLNYKTRRLIISAILVDTDTYEKLRQRLRSDSAEINALDDICWRILNSHDPNYYYSSDTIPFQLFLEGDFKAIRRIADIVKRLQAAYDNPYFQYADLAITMRNMSEDEVEQFIRSGRIIDTDSLGLTYGNIFVLPYYFRFFYGDEWKAKLSFYKSLKNRGYEIWSIEQILKSDIPVQQKKRFLEAIIEAVNSSESNEGTFFQAPFDFDPAMLSQIKNPALFIHFISQYHSRNPGFFNREFLHKKHSLEKQDGNIPSGYQYHLRYKKELLRKIIIIFQHISSLPSVDFYAICNDFKEYLRKGKMTGRIEPYVQYLLNSQDAVDIADKELDVYSQRNFSLVELYDTFLELSPEEETQEESAGNKGDFSGVDRRIERVAQKGSQQLSEERRKLLRNTFRAAAQQSVDDLVMIRDVVQNVLDEVSPEAVNQKVSINTYQKVLNMPDGEQALTVLDIEDTIGMNAERIFNKLLMPFSSSKKDPEKFLGKQGQGFFTLLAGSEYVILKTVRDGKVRILKLTSLRLNGEVVDFLAEEQRRDALSEETNGSRIQAFIKSALPGMEAARVAIAAQRFAGLADSDRLAVIVNGKQININKGKRLAVENSRFGKIEFYSAAGESFIALGGLFVKPLDDGFLALLPVALRNILLEHGFVVNLPFQKIKRIQGGSDIKNREEVYEGIKDAVVLGAMKLVIAMFARGELPSLSLLGNDYYDWVYDGQAAIDAQNLMDGSADIDSISARYFSSDSRNQLAKLLLAIPLDFLRDIFGRPISLAELFERFKTDRQFFNDSVMAKLPQTIKDAFRAIEEKEEKKESQTEAAKELGVPGQFIGKGFISLPQEQGEGMAAFWAFLEISDAIAEIGIEGMAQEDSLEAIGALRERLEYLRDNPARSHYYAEANGLSMAHALQAGRDYAWNLLEQKNNLKLFYQYLSKEISLAEFLDKAFEDIVEILSHELIHILEQSAEGTHNDVFLKRQKLMVSAMIGSRERIAAMLSDIRENPQYADNLKDIPVKDFLDYVVRLEPEIPAEPSRVIITTDPEQASEASSPISWGRWWKKRKSPQVIQMIQWLKDNQRNAEIEQIITNFSLVAKLPKPVFVFIDPKQETPGVVEISEDILLQMRRFNPLTTARVGDDLFILTKKFLTDERKVQEIIIHHELTHLIYPHEPQVEYIYQSLLSRSKHPMYYFVLKDWPALVIHSLCDTWVLGLLLKDGHREEAEEYINSLMLTTQNFIEEVNIDDSFNQVDVACEFLISYLSEVLPFELAKLPDDAKKRRFQLEELFSPFLNQTTTQRIISIVWDEMEPAISHQEFYPHFKGILRILARIDEAVKDVNQSTEPNNAQLPVVIADKPQIEKIEQEIERNPPVEVGDIDDLVSRIDNFQQSQATGPAARTFNISLGDDDIDAAVFFHLLGHNLQKEFEKKGWVVELGQERGWGVALANAKVTLSIRAIGQETEEIQLRTGESIGVLKYVFHCVATSPDSRWVGMPGRAGADFTLKLQARPAVEEVRKLIKDLYPEAPDEAVEIAVLFSQQSMPPFGMKRMAEWFKSVFAQMPGYMRTAIFIRRFDPEVTLDDVIGAWDYISPEYPKGPPISRLNSVSEAETVRLYKQYKTQSLLASGVSRYDPVFKKYDWYTSSPLITQKDEENKEPGGIDGSAGGSTSSPSREPSRAESRDSLSIPHTEADMGGIDFNAAALNMEIKGNSAGSPVFKTIPIDPATFQGFTPLEIGCQRQPSGAYNCLSLTGFTFQIISLEPVTDLVQYLHLEGVKHL